MKPVASQIDVPVKMLGLAFCATLAPQTTLANIGCFGPDQHPVTQEIVAMPGQDGYDPKAYGRLLFAHLKSCLDSETCVAVQAELTPKWDTSAPLPHEQAMKRQEEYHKSSDYQRLYDVTFDYTDFYSFDGVQITSKGPERIAPDFVSGEAYGSNEEFWSLPMQTAGPMIFPVEFGGSGDNIYLHVSSVGNCSIFPLPPADAEAMAVLTACIAQKEC